MRGHCEHVYDNLHSSSRTWRVVFTPILIEHVCFVLARARALRSTVKYATRKRGLDVFLMVYLGLAPLLQPRGYHKTPAGRAVLVLCLAYLAVRIKVFLSSPRLLRSL